MALEIKDLDFHPDGTGLAMIRRGKTDAQGQGWLAYLSRETCRWLKVWLESAKIREGAVFRRLIGPTQVREALNPGSIAPIFKRIAEWIGTPERVVRQVSGHSTRVGATQDLAALDVDLAAITQAGALEVDADATAVCREDQRSAVRNSKGGGKGRAKQSNAECRGDLEQHYQRIGKLIKYVSGALMFTVAQ